MSELTNFRNEKDYFFASHPQSPLTKAQKRTFTGLKYFPENSSLRFNLSIDEFDEKNEVIMLTSTGDTQKYSRFGRISFEVKGEKVELTVFADDHGYFLPFVDSEAGKKTYGAGRYLEPEMLPDGKLLVDFNLAYNPYCAYSEMYSCPIPPAENRLKIPIDAGEMIYRE